MLHILTYLTTSLITLTFNPKKIYLIKNTTMEKEIDLLKENHSDRASTVEYQTVCRKCEFHFLFNECDTYEDKNTSFGVGAPIEKYVKCLKCDHPIMVTHIMK